MEAMTVLRETVVLGHPFKIYGTAEDPLFLAKDVASLIEHSDTSKMLVGVDDEEKLIRTMFVSGQNRDCWFLTESGLYEVLMLSRKPIAKQFKQQVKAILHEIRTKGGYIATNGTESLEELSLRAMTALQAAVDRQKMQIAEQREQLERQAPDVAYCREVLQSTNLHTINTIAVHLGISAIRLNKFLLAEGWIYRQGDIYCPSAKIRSKGYADFHIVPYIASNGETKTREHLKWTESGRRAITDLWCRRNGIFNNIQTY